MVLIEKPPGLSFLTDEAIAAVDFQPHPTTDCVSIQAVTSKTYKTSGIHNPRWNNIERLVVAAGALVKIWVITLDTSKRQPIDIPSSVQKSNPTGITENYESISTVKKDSSDEIIKHNDSIVTDQSSPKTKIGTTRTALSSGTVSSLPDDATSQQQQQTDLTMPSSIVPGSDCSIQSRCVCVIKDHAPNYLVSSRWSPSGNLLATCDNRQIMIFEFIRFLTTTSSAVPLEGAASHDDSTTLNCYDEIWKASIKMTDSGFDIFDLCWFGEDKLIAGSGDGIKIWNLREQSIGACIRFSDGFVKGVRAYGKKFLATQSNDRRVAVWGRRIAGSTSMDIQTSSNADTHDDAVSELLPGYVKLIDETEVMSRGPLDIPYYRRPSFDPAGRLVAFPYGERSAQCFGFAFLLDSLQQQQTTLDHSTQRQPPFRFRGHVSRAFSRGVWAEEQKILTNDNNYDNIPNGACNKKFTLYGQASLDGALSVWKIYYPENGMPHFESTMQQNSTLMPHAECLVIMKPRLLDEQASVTDMGWTSDGLSLVIGADDGSITFIVFTLKELKGIFLPNLKQWTRVSSLPSPPLRLITEGTSHDNITEKNIKPIILSTTDETESDTSTILGNNQPIHNSITGKMNEDVVKKLSDTNNDHKITATPCSVGTQARRRIVPTLISNIPPQQE